MSKVSDLVFYEIYPTSFYDSNGDGIGDLKGIELKLDYIKGMGFNAIWLNPFYLSPFKDGGYDVIDYYKVDPRFGDIDDYKNLVKTAHDKGIKVVIDLVACHMSIQSPLFLKSAEPKRNEYSDLFIWTKCHWNEEDSSKLIMGCYDRDGCYAINYFAHQAALNFGYNKIEYPAWQMSYKDKRTYQARDLLLDVMRYWLAMGTDGFRVDMANYIVKNDDEHKTATIEVWRDYLFPNIRKDYPNAIFISEWNFPDEALEAGFDIDFVLFDNDRFIAQLSRLKKGKNHLWNDTDNDVDCILRGGNVDQFVKDFNYRNQITLSHDGVLGNVSGNHDVIRVSNYLENDKQQKLFYLILFSLPGVPFVYYGDEIRMGYKRLDSKDGGYHRTGSRTPMQWNSGKNAGFSVTEGEIYLPVFQADHNTVEEAINDETSIYHFIKKMISLRQSISDLKVKDCKLTNDGNVLTFVRGSHKLIINLSNKDITLNNEVVFTTGKGSTLCPYEGALISY